MLNMLLCWRCCYIEDVVTLKMLLRWSFCYVGDAEDVEDVATLKMLNMLLRWRCCYMLLRWRCRGLSVEKNGCSFRPWFPGGSWHFQMIKKSAEILSRRNYNGSYKVKINIRWHIPKIKNKKTLFFPHQQSPTMLAPKRMHSMYYVQSLPKNTVKRCKQWHFMILVQLHFNCVPGSLKPLPILRQPHVYTYLPFYGQQHVTSIIQSRQRNTTSSILCSS